MKTHITTEGSFRGGFNTIKNHYHHYHTPTDKGYIRIIRQFGVQHYTLIDFGDVLDLTSCFQFFNLKK